MKIRTADNKVVKPEMILWVDVSGSSLLSHCEKVKEIKDGKVISAYGASIFRNNIMDMSICYAHSKNIKKVEVHF